MQAFSRFIAIDLIVLFGDGDPERIELAIELSFLKWAPLPDGEAACPLVCRGIWFVRGLDEFGSELFADV